MVERREVPGSNTHLIVVHVRNRAGDEGVAAMMDRAALPHDLSALLDDRSWFSYAEEVALFDAAAEVLHDPDLGRHVGDSLFEGPMTKLLPVFRTLGHPGALLTALVNASESFSAIADMEVVEVTPDSAIVRHRMQDGFTPSRHVCGYTMGLLSQIAPVFGMPPAEVVQPACQVDGATWCEYHLRWAFTPRPRRIPGRRARRDHLRGLASRFWELDSATIELVTDGDPTQVLATIAERAAQAVGSTGHLLVLHDPSGKASVIQHGFVGGGGALVDRALSGLVDDDDPTHVVAELASDRHRYGHLVLLFDDGHEPMPEERTILKAYTRRAAIALDAAEAMASARRREDTASVLLQLARALADLSTIGEVASRIADAVLRVTGGDQAGVYLWDPESSTFHARGAAGRDDQQTEQVMDLVVTLEEARGSVPAHPPGEPMVVAKSAARGLLARLMRDLGIATVAIVPIKFRDEVLGAISIGWKDAASVPARDVLDERLVGLGDQASTALENATLLEQVRHQALHDALTGLPNQTLFGDRVTSEITRARRNRTRVAVGVLDLDRFKTVNDSLGHGAGDQLLVQVTERLMSVVRSPDTIARMGGDEFTVLLPDVVDGGENIAAERILESFIQPFEIDGHRLRMSPSIGIAVFPEDGDSFEQLLKCADVAMYRAKDRGRNTWASYATGMSERAYDRLTLETDLYRALQNHEMRVGYQPIAGIDSGRIVGSEALVRWAHPSFGLLLPDEFLSIAEDLGLIAEIDGWVLRQACLELCTVRGSGSVAPYVAVNLSARTLSHPALERMVSDALGAGGLDPERLVIEIREEVTAGDADVITDALRSLRDRGVRIALDDFGRGHSALSRLEHLPIDQLKVDPTFLSNVDDADAPAPVAQAIVDMGHGLGLEVVAEGIETEAHRAFVERLGFDFAQGWFLGRPKAAIDYDGARSRTA